MGIYYAVAAFVVLAIIFIKMTVVIIPQSETRIVERLGKYYATLKPGINLIIPFVDRTKTVAMSTPIRLICVSKCMILHARM